MAVDALVGSITNANLPGFLKDANNDLTRNLLRNVSYQPATRMGGGYAYGYALRMDDGHFVAELLKWWQRVTQAWQEEEIEQASRVSEWLGRK